MLRITRIDLYPCRYPIKGYFKFFLSPQSGEPQGRAAVIVKVTADDGTVGWGRVFRLRRGATRPLRVHLW